MEARPPVLSGPAGEYTQLMQGAISGMMDSLGDAHTIYLSPQNYTEANSNWQAIMPGLAYVEHQRQVVTITKPMPNSPLKSRPASRRQIIAVDGPRI